MIIGAQSDISRFKILPGSRYCVLSLGENYVLNNNLTHISSPYLYIVSVLAENLGIIHLFRCIRLNLDLESHRDRNYSA